MKCSRIRFGILPLIVSGVIHFFTNILPVPDSRMPGHQLPQFLVGRRFAYLEQCAQYQQKVLVRLNSIRPRYFHQRIHNGTGSGYEY